jgi:hypothetical protein
MIDWGWLRESYLSVTGGGYSFCLSQPRGP